MPKNTNALLLFSGGLDSILAARVLLEQEILVTALTFESNFFNAQKARSSARNLNIPLLVADISEIELALVKNPPSGYGKNLNPCIDCHSLMVRLAGQIVKKQPEALDLIKEGVAGDYDLIASGEVLGQRPFSQTKSALARVEKLAGAEVLRPLSAKLMPVTTMEEKGLVRRHLLLDISGRGRDRQLNLAREFGIFDFPAPAGGCLLTDAGFSARLGKMLAYWPQCGVKDVDLLKLGRIFWLDDEKQGQKALLVVARDQKESEELKQVAQKGDIVVELKETVGPSALLRAPKTVKIEEAEVLVPEKITQIDLEKLGNKDLLKLVAFYAPKARGRQQKFLITNIK